MLRIQVKNLAGYCVLQAVKEVKSLPDIRFQNYLKFLPNNGLTDFFCNSQKRHSLFLCSISLKNPVRITVAGYLVLKKIRNFKNSLFLTH